MTDHQHAADSGPEPDAVPSAGTASGRPSAGAAGEEPRARTGTREAEGETAETAAASGPPHRFRRDRPHKMLAGVCAGLGRQCDMDPVIFRITLAVLSATGGIGLIFYGFAWLLVPYEDDDENEVRKLLTGRVDGHALTAVLFALVGCGVFLTMLKNGGVLTFAVVLSFLLAGAGYWSRHRGAPDPDPLAAQAVADAPPEAQAPPVPAAYPSWWRDPIVKDGTYVKLRELSVRYTFTRDLLQRFMGGFSPASATLNLVGAPLIHLRARASRRRWRRDRGRRGRRRKRSAASRPGAGPGGGARPRSR